MLKKRKYTPQELKAIRKNVKKHFDVQYYGETTGLKWSLIGMGLFLMVAVLAKIYADSQL